MNRTPEEIEYIKTELRKYKLPWISRVWKKYGVPFLRYSFLPVAILMVIFGAIYNGSAPGVNDWMWTVDKAIAFFYIFGIGGLALLGKAAERLTANKLRKRLGLSHEDFKVYVQVYGITGM